MKNQRKAVSSEEKLGTINQLEKDKQIFDICCDVRLTCSGIRTTCDNADRIKESPKCLDSIMPTI